jgi:SAM-dependent methyltransferase
MSVASSAVAGAPSGRPVSTHAHVVQLLDRCFAELRGGGSVADTMLGLIDQLCIERSRLGTAWLSVIEHVCRRHPLHALLAQDPFTARARSKPRGYAGDAVMIDYIYSGLPASEVDAVSELGRAIMSTTTSTASGRSVRERRRLLSSRIDACAQRTRKPTIFAVACGHLRELSECAALHERGLGAVRALDQDRESLDEVTRTFGGFPEVIPVAGSVRDLLRRTVEVPASDLVYAAGLYDYLPDGVAMALTQRLFDLVAPGGELLIGNFVPDFPGVAYMEAFMDWALLTRSEIDLRGLCDGIPASSIAGVRTWRDESGCVAYLSLVRT